MSKELLELEALLDLAKKKVAEVKEKEGSMRMAEATDIKTGSKMSEETKKTLIKFLNDYKKESMDIIFPSEQTHMFSKKNIGNIFQEYLIEAEKKNWYLQNFSEFKEYIVKGLKEIVVMGDDPNDFDTHYTNTFIREIVNQILFIVGDSLSDYIDEQIKEIENS